MNHDNITTENISRIDVDNYTLEEDPYKSCIYIKGCINHKTLKHMLKRYSNWNVIEWRVPTTFEGINSQHIALKNGFKVIGYDPGSLLLNNKTTDAVLFGYFPRGVFFSQFKDLDILSSTKPIVNEVLKSVDDILK
jgi:hypothetical protein